MGKIHSVMEIQELVLSAPFAKFERYSVTKIKAKMTRFEQLNDSFGYQMSRMVFNDLFMQKTAQKSRLRGTLRYKISDKNNNNNGNGGRDDSSVLTTQQYPRLDAMWNVWTGQHNNLVSSTHYYPPANNSAVAVSNSTATVDVLLVCGGLLMVSKGTFSEKIDAIFDLFDTQDLGMLGFKQVLRMIRSLFTGWSKLCGFEEPAYDTCVSIATGMRMAFSCLYSAAVWPCCCLCYCQYVRFILQPG